MAIGAFVLQGSMHHSRDWWSLVVEVPVSVQESVHGYWGPCMTIGVCLQL